MLQFALMALTAFGFCSGAPPNDGKKISVLVIGAGASGIAAASKLYPQFDVKVLEAEKRIGGRVNSVEFGDAIVDLGAEWCHGEKGNIVHEMVKDLDILKAVDYPGEYHLSNGSVFDDDLGRELSKLFLDIYYKDEAVDEVEEGITLGYHILTEVTAELEKKYGKNSYQYKNAFLLLNAFKHQILSSEGAFSWLSPSAQSDYESAEGNLQLTWDGKGYKTILDVLLKQYPVVDSEFKLKEQILLGKEVKRIELNENRVSVSCTDNSSFDADHIIFTPSLGVLKHNHASLFTPPLDKDKIYSIENLGFEAVLKVQTHFESRWWPANCNGFSFAWTFEDLMLLPVEFPRGPIKDESSWLSDLMGAYREEKNPNVLSIWFAGNFVPEIEVMPGEILMDGIKFALQKFLGNSYNISAIDMTMQAMWYSNPHFRGTYSYQTIASRKQQNPSSNEILSRPINDSKDIPRILFAGEATNPIHYSTVHGAIETGFREADRLLSLYKN